MFFSFSLEFYLFIFKKSQMPRVSYRKLKNKINYIVSVPHRHKKEIQYATSTKMHS